MSATLLSASSPASAESLFGDEGRLVRFGSSIVSTALHFLGAGNPTPYHEPWCADFVNLVLHKTGRPLLANHTARSALSYGPRTSRPKRGDLIVLKHASHVGIFMGYGPCGEIQMVSGNWSHRVKVARLPRHAVMAFIRT